MHYLSTRGGMEPATYSDVLLEGLAPDGGLTVPDSLPTISRATLESWRGLSYVELATEVLSIFATDLSRETLEGLCMRAYAPENFPTPGVVPLTPLSGGLTLVGLSEGPTLAFKDMAMQFLGQALEHVLAVRGQVLNVLGATSGDTGSAAEYALRGKQGVAVFMLSPQGRMSDVQRAQMYSLTDENVHNLAVAGVFDDCQALVKQLSADLDFKRRNSLGTVNSINLGRISAQVVYYFWAWLRASDALDAAARATFVIDVTVPSGNFGNILSGHYARQLGVPIRRLVLATNENNVLDEFFRTGHYRPRNASETHATSSPSMDISAASNVERFFFELVGRDPQKLRELWDELARTGTIDVADQRERLREEFGFVSGSSTHEDRRATIRSVFHDDGVVIDPHTADGVHVARSFVQPDTPMLVLETAKAAKFPEIVEEATGALPALPERLADILSRTQQVTEIGNDAEVLRQFIDERAVRH